MKELLPAAHFWRGQTTELRRLSQRRKRMSQRKKRQPPTRHRLKALSAMNKERVCPSSQIALLASVQQFLDRQHGLYIDGAPAPRRAKPVNRLGSGHGQAIATTADASPADVDWR